MELATELSRLYNRLNQYERGTAKANECDKYGLITNITTAVYSTQPELAAIQLNHILGFLNRLLILSDDVYNRNSFWEGSMGEINGAEAYIPYEVPESLSDEERQRDRPLLRMELETYYQGIKQLHAQLTPKKPESAGEGKMEIHLPEKFKLPEITNHFQPKLSAKQTALLLCYLKDAELIPQYANSSLGTISTVFFGRSQKTVSDFISTVYSVKKEKEELRTLREQLQNLIKLIDKDL